MDFTKSHSLEQAIMNKDSIKISYLLDSGVDPNIYIDSNFTPIMIAADIGHLNTIKLLKRYGADLNIMINGYTPLIIACLHGRFEIVQYLVGSGADINLHEKGNDTPLLHAISKIKIKNGEYVEQFNSKEHNDITFYLIDKGADLAIKGKDKLTAYKLANIFHLEHIADYIKKKEKALKSSSR